MQHIAKQFVGLRREKAESRIRYPFERHRFAAASNRGVALALAHTLPRDAIPRRRQRRCVVLGGAFKPGFGIVENVDVGGEARAVAVDGDTASNIAVGAALRRKRAQYVRLKLTDWHGKARS